MLLRPYPERLDNIAQLSAVALNVTLHRGKTVPQSLATTSSPVDEETWRFACTRAMVICRYELYDWQSLEKSLASSEDRWPPTPTKELLWPNGLPPVLKR
ncbi:hypothetical protein ACFFJN_02450 [Erwinia mallotivora]|uniref:hypothetical protein n=1 Tax=Erwinia mallotivora TaxID=69222 RepID=UPI0035E4E648